jgi:hypothetical protein
MKIQKFKQFLLLTVKLQYSLVYNAFFANFNVDVLSLFLRYLAHWKTIFVIFHNCMYMVSMSLLLIVAASKKETQNIRSCRWGDERMVKRAQTVSEEIFRRTSLQSHLQTPPPTPSKSYPKFWNHWTTFQNTPLFRPKIA